MALPSILVTGATGRQGRGVVEHCLALEHRPTVYALTRDPTSAAAERLRALGAVPVGGDLDDEASLAATLAERQPAVAFLVLPAPDPQAQVAQAKRFVAAVRGCASIRAVVYSSSVGTGVHDRLSRMGPQNPWLPYWTAKQAVEDLVRGAGFPALTVARLPFFLTNLLPGPEAAAMFPELWPQPPAADGKKTKKPAPAVGALHSCMRPDVRLDVAEPADVGRVAAAVLARPDELAGRTVDVAGDSLTMTELATAIERATGRRVNAVHETPEAMQTRLGMFGPYLAEMFLNLSEMGPTVDVEAMRRDFGATTAEEFFRQVKL